MSGMNGNARPIQPEVAEELIRIGVEAYEWRRQAGLTQRAMEALTGLDQTTICKLERGKLQACACITSPGFDSQPGPARGSSPRMGGPNRRAVDDARVIRGEGQCRQPNGNDGGGNDGGQGRRQVRSGFSAPQGLDAKRPEAMAVEDPSEGARCDPSIGRASRAPRPR